MAVSKTSRAGKSVNLALQGGGSHGAFTWGVLDHLLCDERIEIAAISGTSAGAMNAVIVADGLMRGGPAEACAGLEAFWKAISKRAQWSPVRRTAFDYFTGNWSLELSPGYHMFDAMTRIWSPYLLNPMDLNPLRDVLEKSVDFELVRSCDILKLFISATNVETGRVEVFDRKRLTCEMVMASACLPLLFKAVEIDGVPYWDGGYMGNPSLFPLFGETDTNDIVIVQINPIERKGTPITSHDILNRLNEISFNGSLLKELRSIDFVRRLIEQGRLSTEDYSDIHIHVIEAQDKLKPMGASSKMNAEWAFLCHLRDIGRAAAESWVTANWEQIGERSTVDLREMFQGKDPHLS